MAENFPNLKKTINLQIQKPNEPQTQETMKVTTPRDIRIIFLKTRDKCVILKATAKRKRKRNMYKGKKLRNMANYLIGNIASEETVDQLI